jgi:hypothetical protein
MEASFSCQFKILRSATFERAIYIELFQILTYNFEHLIKSEIDDFQEKNSRLKFKASSKDKKI